VALLKLHTIQTVVDVRSTPYSSYTRWFNRENLKPALWKEGVTYLFRGDTLGGFPEDPRFYDGSWHTVYERLSVTDEFKKSLNELAALAIESTLALMCTQENPMVCHRHPLLTRLLIEREYKILHIRATGELEEGYISQPASEQLALLEIPGEDSEWRSPRAAKRRKG